MLDPPARVWVKTSKLLPPAWDRSGQRLDGLRIEVETPGLLYHWAPTSDGGWLGWVAYEIWTADERWAAEVKHYVPAHLIRRRGFSRRNRGEAPRRRTHG